MNTASRDEATRAEAECNSSRLPMRANRRQAKIHIFCEDEGTRQAAAEAMRDRRLEKLGIELHMGGVGAARAMFASAPTPSLIVVESRLEPATMLADLKTLSEVCDAGTKVVVIGHVNDVRLYRELVRRHITDYVVAPVSAAQFAETIAGGAGWSIRPAARPRRRLPGRERRMRLQHRLS